jgi:MazG family protein
MSQTPPSPDAYHPVFRLLEIMDRLRDPSGGCAWDLEQTFATIAPYTVEEAYEVADAIERNDLKDLKEELGDLLFQVVFHARMARSSRPSTSPTWPPPSNDKMIRRHPHVFGDVSLSNRRRADRRLGGAQAAGARRQGQRHGMLDDVPVGLPCPYPRREAVEARRPGRVRLAQRSTRCSTSSTRRSPN